MATRRKTAVVPLGILAGSGSLPLTVARAAQQAGRPVHIVAIEGHADPAIESFPHSWVNMGRVGAILKALDSAKCRDLVIIGAVDRPNLEDVRLDMGGVRSILTILSLTIGGDDRLLGNVVRFFEGKGLRVIGAHEVAPGLLAPRGTLGRRKPSRTDLDDIRLGARVIAALGPMDVGQSAVVLRQHVIAVEAVEGTDAMLARAATLRKWGLLARFKRSGVVVKGSKPGQDRRVDMATIGPETVRQAAAAHLAGIAYSAGAVIIVDREAMIAEANRAGLFLHGFSATKKG